MRCTCCHNDVSKKKNFDGSDVIQLKPGTVAVCQFCGHTYIVQKDFTYRDISDRELNIIFKQFPSLASKLKVTYGIIEERIKLN